MKQISFRRMSSKPCAICHNKAHKGYLSAAAVKEHQCCEKNCPFLQKLEHDYWLQCERKKLEKRTMKLLMRHHGYTKDASYKKVKEMTLTDLRGFVEVNDERQAC